MHRPALREEVEAISKLDNEAVSSGPCTSPTCRHGCDRFCALRMAVERAKCCEATRFADRHSPRPKRNRLDLCLPQKLSELVQAPSIHVKALYPARTFRSATQMQPHSQQGNPPQKRAPHAGSSRPCRAHHIALCAMSNSDTPPSGSPSSSSAQGVLPFRYTGSSGSHKKWDWTLTYNLANAIFRH